MIGTKIHNNFKRYTHKKKKQNLNLIVPVKYYDTRRTKRTIYLQKRIFVPFLYFSCIFWLKNYFFVHFNTLIMGDMNVRWLDSMSRE